MATRTDLQEEMFDQLQERGLFELAKDYALAYMQTLRERNVYPTEAALEDLKTFDEPLPARSGDPAEILRALHEYGSPATVATDGGRYFGFVIGSSLPVGLAARWLADVWDQNAGLNVASPIAAKLESTCEKWLVKILGLAEGTAAGFVSGTTEANLCGLAAARNEILRRQGWDVPSDGLFGAPDVRVILGAQAHASVHKALSLLGMGRNRVEVVPADDQGRMIAAELPELDEHCIVIVQAGNVNSGAFDPIRQVCEKAKRAGAWVHVDGAFGLWAAVSRKLHHLVDGLEMADSWAVDAHKTLNVPYDSGIVLCKDRQALVSAMLMSGSYFQLSEQRDGLLYGPDMSRRARGVELWATLKYLGSEGVEELVERLCTHAMNFAEKLKENGFNILNEVVYNQVLVTCDTPEQTRTTLANIQKSGEIWCGGATWNNEPVIRISVCSWATTEADIERSVKAFVKARKE